MSRTAYDSNADVFLLGLRLYGNSVAIKAPLCIPILSFTDIDARIEAPLTDALSITTKSVLYTPALRRAATMLNTSLPEPRDCTSTAS